MWEVEGEVVYRDGPATKLRILKLQTFFAPLSALSFILFKSSFGMQNCRCFVATKDIIIQENGHHGRTLVYFFPITPATRSCVQHLGLTEVFHSCVFERMINSGILESQAYPKQPELAWVHKFKSK